jgi:acetyl esterase/lipase
VRKVLVFGAAFAATALSAAAVPSHAGSDPDPWATGTVPSAGQITPTPTVSPPTSTGEPAPTTSATPRRRPTERTRAPRPTGPATARAVMVTPPNPEQKTFSYGRSARQRVDVYWSADDEGAETRPGVLLLHGGSWRGGDKSSWRYTARKLVAQGYTVYAANYRLTSQAPWPAQRQDALSALRWIHRTAERWRTDPRRIVVVGSSAGGHLATQLGTYLTGSSRLRGVIALSPVNSPYLAYQDGGKPNATQEQVNLRTAVTQLVGCTPSEQDAECWRRLEDASAVAHVTGDDAPMLLMHTAKEFVSTAHSTALEDALKTVGVRSAVRVFPGSDHGGAMLRDEQIFTTVVRWIEALT